MKVLHGEQNAYVKRTMKDRLGLPEQVQQIHVSHFKDAETATVTWSGKVEMPASEWLEILAASEEVKDAAMADAGSDDRGPE